jgi:phosphate transport system permease protein
VEPQLSIPAEPAGPNEPARTSRRRLATDRFARWAVVAGGLAIIAGILGILVFILLEVWPLFTAPRVEAASVFDVDGFTLRSSPAERAKEGAVVADEYRSHAAVLSVDGTLRVVRLSDGTTVVDREIASDGFTVVRSIPGTQLLAGATTDGRVVAVPIDWRVTYTEARREIEPVVEPPVPFELDPLGGAAVLAFAVRLDADGRAMAAGQLEDGTLVLVERRVRENALSGEISETVTRTTVEAPASLRLLVIDDARETLYGASATGSLFWWPIGADGIGPTRTIPREGAPITALTLLVGGRSLILGAEDGALSVWFKVDRPDGHAMPVRIRTFPKMPGPIRLLSPSMRDKGFLAQDESGRLGLYYSTSHRVLWTGESPLPEATALFYAPKADGAILAQPGRIATLDIDNPHPEVGFSALFDRVWYEGYDAPAWVWQSSAATDEFEPKLSLTPLLFGTLKGTLYSMFLAVPLGVLGAMYTSQFMHPRLKAAVKPVVEIMAALPSVVLGFLAGLWLAPRVEKLMPALILMNAVLPLAVLAAWALLRTMPRKFRSRMITGSEAALYMVAIVAGMWLAIAIGPAFEAVAFGGSFQEWLLDTTGLRYDQRNAVVVGLAMGFAVIPVIFAIAEDAFSNVPRVLVSGSLALGANRWQTVTRVVLPTASPGIFSAVMIGFGRAIGETMIVLMATGNTPIMDWNPFNGFRTLSANIAVEIPEAPHGGTLYRTLFLAALLLFVLTFVLNTVAELVRQRLRRRYAQL